MESPIIIENLEIHNVFNSRTFSQAMEEVCKEISSVINAKLEDDFEKKIVGSVECMHVTVSSTLSEIDKDFELVFTRSQYQSKEDESKITCLKDSKEHLYSLITHIKDNAETLRLFPNPAAWHDSLCIQLKEIIHLFSETFQYWEACKVVILKLLIKECISFLQRLQQSTSAEAILCNFKNFVDSLSCLINRLKELASDALDIDRQTSFESFVTLLLHSSLFLGKVLKVVFRYCSNGFGKIRLQFVIQVLHSVLSKVLSYFVDSSEASLSCQFNEETGHFVTKMDMVLDILSPDQRYLLKDKLEIITEVTIEYCMTVAQLSEDNDKMDVMSSCQQVLKLKKEAMNQYENNELVEKASESRMCLEFDIACEALSKEFEKLERLISKIVLKAISRNFMRRERTINELLKKATELKESKSTDRSSLEPFIDSFTDNFDKLHQTALFTLACSTDLKKAGHISSWLTLLESLDPEIIPAVVCYIQADENCGRNCVEYLRVLHHQWKLWSDGLYNAVIAITDLGALVQSNLTVMKEVLERLKSTFSNEEVLGFIGHATEVHKLLSLAEPSVVRKKKLQDLNLAIHAVDKTRRKISDDKTDMNQETRLFKCMKIVISSAAGVTDLVKGQSMLMDSDFNTIEPSVEPESTIETNLRAQTCHKASFKEEESSDSSCRPINENQYSLADMLEEITSEVVKISDDSARTASKADSYLSTDTSFTRKYKSYLDGLSDETKSRFNVIKTSYRDSILEKSRNNELIIWEEENNSMVAIAVEMYELLNHLMNCGQDLMMADDVVAICDDLHVKAEELASLSTSIANMTSEARTVAELRYRSEQVTSSCSQLKMIINLARLNSDDQTTFRNDVSNILPKFSSNVKRDICCVLHEAELSCSMLGSAQKMDVAIPEWKVKDNLSITATSFSRNKRSMRRRISLRRAIFKPFDGVPCD